MAPAVLAEALWASLLHVWPALLRKAVSSPDVAEQSQGWGLDVEQQNLNFLMKTWLTHLPRCLPAHPHCLWSDRALGARHGTQQTEQGLRKSAGPHDA